MLKEALVKLRLAAARWQGMHWDPPPARGKARSIKGEINTQEGREIKAVGAVRQL